MEPTFLAGAEKTAIGWQNQGKRDNMPSPGPTDQDSEQALPCPWSH